MTTTAKPKPRRATDPALQELHKLLLKSEKFLNWKPAYEESGQRSDDDGIITACFVKDKHYTPSELAELWGVSAKTIREIFRNEEGVLKIGSNGTRTRRAYKTLRIPESVAERVHTRLSA